MAEKWHFGPSSGGRWYIYTAGEKQPITPNVYVPKGKLNNKVLMGRARLMSKSPQMRDLLLRVLQSGGDMPTGLYTAIEELLAELQAGDKPLATKEGRDG